MPLFKIINQVGTSEEVLLCRSYELVEPTFDIKRKVVLLKLRRAANERFYVALKEGDPYETISEFTRKRCDVRRAATLEGLKNFEKNVDKVINSARAPQVATPAAEVAENAKERDDDAATLELRDDKKTITLRSSINSTCQRFTLPFEIANLAVEVRSNIGNARVVWLTVTYVNNDSESFCSVSPKGATPLRTQLELLVKHTLEQLTLGDNSRREQTPEERISDKFRKKIDSFHRNT